MKNSTVSRREQIRGMLADPKVPGALEAVDEAMAAALIDRILHHCHIVNIRGNSYRMREHTELWKALHHTDPEDAPQRGRSGKRAKEVRTS